MDLYHEAMVSAAFFCLIRIGLARLFCCSSRTTLPSLLTRQTMPVHRTTLSSGEAIEGYRHRMGQSSLIRGHHYAAIS